MSSILDGAGTGDTGAFTSYLRDASKTTEPTINGESICILPGGPGVAGDILDVVDDGVEYTFEDYLVQACTLLACLDPQCLEKTTPSN